MLAALLPKQRSVTNDMSFLDKIMRGDYELFSHQLTIIIVQFNVHIPDSLFLPPCTTCRQTVLSELTHGCEYSAWQTQPSLLNGSSRLRWRLNKRSSGSPQTTFDWKHLSLLSPRVQESHRYL